QAGSFLLPPSPGPRPKLTLSALQRKYLHTELTSVSTKLTQTAPEKSSENLDPESLYPWRPDCTYLLEIHPFTFLIICCTIKHHFTDSVLLRVLLYVGQSYSENNDI
ncbi:hypothetical protein ATANTOWER_030377, partial [Ataeniobius toweri]|nr:hypothetical protein [Ataeniobius toweri]